ncbi:MAG: energy-coupling factor transporter ATPase [Syntrophomonadaceae bacterium]
MIEINDLTFLYDSNQGPALENLNLSIKPGEYVALIGPNGGGKTTLARHFNGLLTPTQGAVWIDGLNTSSSKNRKEIRRLVGMIFQNPDNQIVGMTVEEDVAFGPGNLGLPPAEIRRRVDNALATVGLSEWGKRPPHTLSGGQKQLLAIAGLLAMDPTTIVLDEPTAALDASGKTSVYRLIEQLNKQGMTIVYVTQDMEEAARAGRVLVLHQGRLAADGSPAEVLTRVEWLQSLGLAPPRLVQLMHRLRNSGFDLETDGFDIERVCQEIGLLVAGRRPMLDRKPRGV